MSITWHKVKGDEGRKGWEARNADGVVVAEAWRDTSVPSGYGDAWRSGKLGFRTLTDIKRYVEQRERDECGHNPPSRGWAGQ